LDKDHDSLRFQLSPSDTLNQATAYSLNDHPTMKKQEHVQCPSFC
jgi:hypothetical protein